MKIAIGCDHGGINLKPVLMDYLESKGVEYVDYGCFGKDSVDYNDYAVKVTDAVTSGECTLGILICGTGIGMSIMANKVRGIRCGHCQDVFSAKMTRLHNDANVLAVGERVLGPGLFLEIVEAFIFTEFSNDQRHVRRVEKIKALEEKNFKKQPVEQKQVKEDEMFLKALSYVVKSGKASISAIQRRFCIGYARAGGLIDKMEEMGFVEPNNGSAIRRTLLTEEQYKEKFGELLGE